MYKLEVEEPLRGLTSSWKPYGPLDFVFYTFRPLKPSDDQRPLSIIKFKSFQVVINTVRSFGKIQLTMFEKYSREEK